MSGNIWQWFYLFFLIINKKEEPSGFARDCLRDFLYWLFGLKNIQNGIRILHYLKLVVALRPVLMRDCNWANLNCSVAAWASRKTLMIDLCRWVGISLWAFWVEAEHPAGRIKREKGEELFITLLLTFYGSVMVNCEMNAYIHVFCTILRH